MILNRYDLNFELVSLLKVKLFEPKFINSPISKL